MANSVSDTRVHLLGNPDKPEAPQLLSDLRSFFEGRCRVTGADLSTDAQPAVRAGADRVVVLGGDGTLIGVARALGQSQIPLIGVNVGKLGYLAEFSVDELKAGYEAALTDESIISRRAALHVVVSLNGQRDGGLAINDCVIQAGAPFRMVTLGVSVNGDHLTDVRGDGIIVCTPSGSTAHNLSAGGPIMQSGVDAIVLTPLNPHSLTHRPLVIEHDAVIDILATAVNEGTTAIIDGQVPFALGPGDRVSVRRAECDIQLVRNPAYAKWHKLVTKLHWGRAPEYE